jgi:hypothetical protein
LPARTLVNVDWTATVPEEGTVEVAITLPQVRKEQRCCQLAAAAGAPSLPALLLTLWRRVCLSLAVVDRRVAGVCRYV